MTEAELLFTHIMQCDFVDLYLSRKQRLDKNKSFQIAKVLRKRLKGEPLEYILGKTEFMGLEFKVNTDVFIPHPDTEILVETVIRLAKDYVFKDMDILDMGTGSGCIAVSLAKNLPYAKITATDISPKAIEIARQNSRLNNIIDRINFVVADLFDSDKLQVENYDFIVSNPPYIPSLEIQDLANEIQWQPQVALDGGEDGLCFYRRIIRSAPYYLKKDGYLVLEFGFNQRRTLEDILIKSRNFEIIDIVNDYNGIERVIVAKNNKNG
ncbi:MAG: peptide chain release factor N(5)-glutamine methyltransferase [Candidatus Omnitrophica bacterium]|nr:peptide chain release factor N(5)-glutamine methyltransferase [Candidatus Omnitrophota bacterium]